MDTSLNDTIVALATPKGKGALAIIRLSGSSALEISANIFRGKKDLKKAPNQSVILGRVYSDDSILDEVMAVVYRKPQSYTGEDMVEFTVHGSKIIIESVLEALTENGARYAQPGEFTFRRFINGKIDLLQAEAVVDIINATTKKALESALKQLEGNLSDRLARVRTELHRIQTELTASIDFPEEQLETMPLNEIKLRLNDLIEDMNNLLENYKMGKILHHGLTVVIAGKPNVGKSSLFNQLLGENRAIVSSDPGTTRDMIDSVCTLEGIPVRLYDTAGIRIVENHIEIEGVKKAREQLTEADLILLLIDISKNLDTQDFELLDELKEQPMIIALNKKDLEIKEDTLHFIHNQDTEYCSISALTGEGIDELESKIVNSLGLGDGLDEANISALRHKKMVQESLKSLVNSCKNLEEGTLEIAVTEVERGIKALNKLLGDDFDHDVLDEVFGNFCIGK
ncbi:tRNA uridine-5-carboxymethylaminomethyl(34) synthesis GTPase MnmE [bacterium]|nr:tRNA uridine-5-carboxymethylaminomethyl(34) synthesis GTPase MnmE [bacterium]